MDEDAGSNGIWLDIADDAVQEEVSGGIVTSPAAAPADNSSSHKLGDVFEDAAGIAANPIHARRELLPSLKQVADDDAEFDYPLISTAPQDEDGVAPELDAFDADNSVQSTVSPLAQPVSPHVRHADDAGDAVLQGHTPRSSSPAGTKSSSSSPQAAAASQPAPDPDSKSQLEHEPTALQVQHPTAMAPQAAGDTGEVGLLETSAGGVAAATSPSDVEPTTTTTAAPTHQPVAAAAQQQGAAAQQQGAATSTNAAADEQLDEWDLANKARLAELQEHAQAASCAARPQLLSYPEALSHFLACDLSHLRPAAEERLQISSSSSSNSSSSSSSTENRGSDGRAGGGAASGGAASGTASTGRLLPQAKGGCGSGSGSGSGLLGWLLCSFLGPRPLPVALQEEKVQLTSLSLLAFEDSDSWHLDLLSSLFAAITGAGPAPPPRRGAHWAQLGFQGDDPTTDLRGCGVLGLLHLHCLQHHSGANAQQLFRLSRSCQQEFPLAIVSLNVTKWVLQCLRAGALDGLSRQHGSVVGVAERLYVGVMYAFYIRWLQGRSTMAASGLVLRRLELECKRKPARFLQLCQQQLQPCPYSLATL